jgi:hypothetical protein
MELLPALALFAGLALAAAEQRFWRPQVAEATAAGATPAGAVKIRPMYLAVLALAILNPLAMIFGTPLAEKVASKIELHPSNLLASYSPPLVLKEALVNATTRVPFEENLALVLEEIPPGAPILMTESDHIGALQDAGIALKQTLNESDFDSWHAALEDPAGKAAYVIALDGDPVAKAVAAHPDGLEELSITCGTGQPCARMYQSDRYQTMGVPVQK